MAAAGRGGENGVLAVEKMEKNGREKYVAAVRAARNDVAFLCVSGARACWTYSHTLSETIRRFYRGRAPPVRILSPSRSAPKRTGSCVPLTVGETAPFPLPLSLCPFSSPDPVYARVSGDAH